MLARAVTNKAPVPYTSRGARFALPFSGRNDAVSQMQAMGTVGTLFSIVHRTSNAASQVDWKLWRRAASGKDEDRVEQTSHLALDIWRKPNPFMPRQEFVESTQQHVDLTGEGWWVVARNPRMRSIPLELWPVRPDRMIPVPHPQDFLAGYIYVSPDGEQVPLRLDEVIQLRMPNPMDPYRGMGPVQSILAELDATRYSAEWNRNFFVNSALPSGIIEAPQNLGDEEFNQLRDRWEEQHRGVAAAHRVAILEGGLKWVDRKFTQRDMQFVELRQVSRDVIREAFGMPKFALGDVDDVNRAVGEASAAWFAEYLTVPRLERIKAALNHDFLPLFGDTARDLEFDYEDPVPPDAESRDRERTSKATAAKLYVDAGFTGESVVEALDLPDTLVWKEPAPQPSPAPAAPPPPGPSPDALLRRLQVRAAADPVTGREDWEDRLEDLLAEWEQISEDQRRELLDQIRRVVDEGAGEGAAQGLVGLAVSSGVAAALLEAVMVLQAEAAAGRMVEVAAAQGVAIEPAPVSGALAAALAAGAAVTAALLASSLAVAAGRAALRVWAPGMTGEQVAGRVGAWLESLTDAGLRAELGGAIWAAENLGRFATLELAIADGRGATWYEASEIRDSNTCFQCRDIDGERFDTLRDVRESYPHGGFFACLGTIRCRGTVEPHWGDS
ncbi:phage portal protein [Nonomuraea sp. SBT364]|uniref:phage portal protein n=1 Tax=Nonomuraea sp. SBT364 TaxID=1580530 RepID=UPI00066A53F0|nr:phage portal protein [Nonomuraea sp. SBT364]